jgi:hypothetical protein
MPILALAPRHGLIASGYYAWAKRPTCERAGLDAALSEKNRAAHATSKGMHGVRRLQATFARMPAFVSASLQ